MSSPPEHGLLFEPAPAFAAKLQNRFAEHRTIEVIEMAAGNASGVSAFFEQPDSPQNSSLIEASSSSSDVRVNDVIVTTIDAALASRGIRHVDLLKIDAEGCDLRVLQGASELLKRQAVDVVQFEYNDVWRQAGSKLADAYGLIEASGYELFLLKSAGLFKLRYHVFKEFYHYANFVAVSPAGLAAVKPLLKGLA
jgi:FkbM family methyltransferase